jgi:hypothetical protein
MREEFILSFHRFISDSAGSIHKLKLKIVMCRVVHATKMMGSTFDDWIS